MPDDRRASAPSPYLRTRPATMFTALGLCLLVMIMQLVPEARDSVQPHIHGRVDQHAIVAAEFDCGRLCKRPGTRI